MSLRHALPGLIAVTLVVPAAAQVPPDQQADMILTSARKAANEGNYPFAVQRLQRVPPEVRRPPAGEHGPVPTGPRVPRFAGAELRQGPREPWARSSGTPRCRNTPYALYHAGLCLRGLGLREVDRHDREAERGARSSSSGPTAGSTRRPNGSPGATAAFTAKLPEGTRRQAAARPRLGGPLPVRPGRDGVAGRQGEGSQGDHRAVRQGRALAKSKYAKLGLYHHGFAAFQTQDYLVAGRSLAQLAPFDDPHTGLHARYLMGRVYQATESKAEAAQAFEAVVAGYEQQKKDAAEALKKPEQFAKNPAERARLEALVRNPPPDYVAASVFHAACLGYEAGKFGEALGKFQEFVKAFPQSPQVPEAQLRIGFCQVQLKAYPGGGRDAAAAASTSSRSSRTRCCSGSARPRPGRPPRITDPTKAADRDNGLKTAINTLRAAADRANQMAQSDPEAKTRRAEMLLELADTQQLAKQYARPPAPTNRSSTRRACPPAPRS